MVLDEETAEYDVCKIIRKLLNLDVLERVVDIISLFGYWGIAFLMLLENIIPPIPSELIMPLAGFAVARGEMNMAIAIAAGTFGSVLGGLAWYYVGRILGLRKNSPARRQIRKMARHF